MFRLVCVYWYLVKVHDKERTTFSSTIEKCFCQPNSTDCFILYTCYQSDRTCQNVSYQQSSWSCLTDSVIPTICLIVLHWLWHTNNMSDRSWLCNTSNLSDRTWLTVSYQQSIWSYLTDYVIPTIYLMVFDWLFRTNNLSDRTWLTCHTYNLSDRIWRTVSYQWSFWSYLKDCFIPTIYLIVLDWLSCHQSIWLYLTDFRIPTICLTGA